MLAIEARACYTESPFGKSEFVQNAVLWKYILFVTIVYKKERNLSTGIMIIGPSGSGKTTLGKVVAEKLGYPYFDVDDYIWRQGTVDPYTQMCIQGKKR